MDFANRFSKGSSPTPYETLFYEHLRQHSIFPNHPTSYAREATAHSSALDTS
ncbi:hypothetical protein L209DRAFT_756341 [Thermothelomyces heterothallicus CBS 203.75]